jgi:hypothetical protein
MENSKRYTESYPYFHLPAFIEELRGLRGKLANVNIDFSIILFSTIIIESVFHDLSSLTINEYIKSDTIEGRLANDLLDKIDKATWNDLSKITEILFNKKLNKCVGNELWNTIKNLYKYRNYIVHGKPFVVSIIQEKGKKIIKQEGRISKVIEFLIQKKLITAEKPAILNNDISDFFWNSTKEFVIAISSELKNEYNEIVFLMLQDAIKNKFR